MIDLFGYERPALGRLIGAMERLPRRQRREIAQLGRKARAAKMARVRHLAREAELEARRLVGELNGELSR
ncbi:hypothetical protein IVA86_33170 [Bradyrhizobium sp. 146]|uniref:hypothetical protein n=1 Tax=Bradyrhizobium sp. 146 TaxID=2782622 RepID=UPI001FF89B3C|nr:hypothetical protein [Bradyrhizobium sp. 146]MCK1706125.1 hypothetical protein [Bradyrhizobium sp. 146]